MKRKMFVALALTLSVTLGALVMAGAFGTSTSAQTESRAETDVIKVMEGTPGIARSIHPMMNSPLWRQTSRTVWPSADRLTNRT